MKDKPTFNTTWVQKQKPLNFDDPNHDIVYKQKAQNVPSIKTHITNSCTVAWNSVTIDEKGRVFTCLCDGYVPFPVGNVEDFKSFNEIFSSPQALLTQESIVKKEFKYCATQFCGVESSNKSYRRGNIYLGINLDVSCNLSCPSCRERTIFINDKEILDNKLRLAKIIYSWIISTDKTIIIELAGGDPFVSLVYIDMIELFANADNAKFQIKTNGILLESHLGKFSSDRIHSMSISIDAASADVYERVRRGGKWIQLLDNLEYLKSTNIKNVVGNFVIQRDNVGDIIPFVDFCQQYNLIPNYWVVQDWGTWINFEEHCVHIPASPYYQEFKQAVSTLTSMNVYHNLNNWL